MTLQRKFVVLLGVLGATVAVNLGTTLWAIITLEKELAAPLASIEPVLRGLHSIKRKAEEQGKLLAPPSADEHGSLGARFEEPASGEAHSPPDEGAAGRFRANQRAISAEIERLEGIETFRLRSGISTSRNLKARLASADEHARRWLETGDPGVAATTNRLLFEIHELIELIEGRMVADAREALVFAGRVRWLVLLAVIVSVGAVVLSGWLGLTLVRRWVLRPVADLRRAAGRLAQGDFSVRVPVEGGHELALLSSEINHMASMISAMQDERVERERLAAVGEMVRRLAHNLRNPLAGIRSLAELTRLDLARGSEARENQDRIIGTVDRFELWLKDLLGATTPAVVLPRPVAVRGWLEGVCEPLRAAAAARRVELETRLGNAPVEAVLDPRHMEQALVCLISNAIEACGAGDRVTVEARTCPPGGWEVSIADEGPGVPPELMGKIFRPYFTTKRNGTGIGLAIAKHIAEQHGGGLSVQNRPNRPPRGEESGPGAVFVLALPLDTRAALANIGQLGVTSGQDPDHRGRAEPEVLDPAGPLPGRA